MKQRLIILLSLLLTTVAGLRAETASQLLDRAAKTFSSAGSISASYTLTSSGAGTTKGTLLFSGQKFVMTSPQLKTWYDGKTQWTLLIADNEVNVTEPTAAELQEVNPFAIINTFRSGYNAKELKAPAGQRKLQLSTRTKQSQIRSSIILLDSKTLLPTKIQLTMTGGQKVDIALTGVSKGPAKSTQTFQFQKKQHPGVDVIDLR